MNIDRIYEAQEKLKNVIKRTPLVRSQSHQNVYLKMEQLQSTGSFKIRGAYNKIASLTDEQKKRGVIASSAGNHAQGVAKSATERGIKSIICMPYHAPLSKVEATKNYGAEVVLVKDSFDDAYRKARELEEEKGYTFIHPFDDELVIAGQGTIGLEILEDLPDVDVIVAPIGGGGLISGIAVAVKELKKDVKVIGVQTKVVPGMYESIKDGEIIKVRGGATIADGISVKTPGKLTFELVQDLVDDIVLVGENEISSAILHLMERDKIVTEGAAASTYAAIMHDLINIKNKKVCCVLSGGNIDVTRISKVIDKGLYATHRSMSLDVRLEDVPGEMVRFTKLLEKAGSNILKIQQNMDIRSQDIDAMIVSVVVSTRDLEHQHLIETMLKEADYSFAVK